MPCNLLLDKPSGPKYLIFTPTMEQMDAPKQPQGPGFGPFPGAGGTFSTLPNEWSPWVFYANENLEFQVG